MFIIDSCNETDAEKKYSLVVSILMKFDVSAVTDESLHTIAHPTIGHLQSEIRRIHAVRVVSNYIEGVDIAQCYRGGYGDG